MAPTRQGRVFLSEIFLSMSVFFHRGSTSCACPHGACRPIACLRPPALFGSLERWEKKRTHTATTKNFDCSISILFFLKMIDRRSKCHLKCAEISSGAQVFRPSRWFDASHPDTLPLFFHFLRYSRLIQNQNPQEIEMFFFFPLRQNEILCLIPVPHCTAAAGKSHGLSLKFIRWRLKAAVLWKDFKVHSFNPHRKWAERLSDNVPPCLLRAYCIFLRFDLSPCVWVCDCVCASLPLAGLHNVSVRLFKVSVIRLPSLMFHCVSYILENMRFTQQTAAQIVLQAEMRCDVVAVFPPSWLSVCLPLSRWQRLEPFFIKGHSAETTLTFWTCW